MSINRKQSIAIAAIVLLGLAGSGAVLLSGGHADGDGHAHGDSHGQEDKEGAHHDEDEGLLRLSAQQRRTAGIAVAIAGPATLQPALEFQGEIRFNEDRTAHVVPRLSGVAEAVPVSLGQAVRKGQVLAVVASAGLSDQRSELLAAQRRQEAARQSHDREKRLWEDRISAAQDYQQAETALREADIAVANARQKLAAIGAAGGTAGAGLNRFEVRAPFDGMVVEKHLALGEAVKEDASIFTVSDLSTVWAEFAVAPQDLGTVRVGQTVEVSSSASPQAVEGRVAYVGALLGEQTRTARARVTLANPQGAWRPGLFVTVRVLGAAQPVPLAVPKEAVQTVDGRATVFQAVEGGFRAVPVRTGRTDGQVTEVLEGLEPGAEVATKNAFVLKSEQGKASASHAH